MIHYTTGNVLESSAEALVNTVNTVGVMGKGIALQFKKAYPNNFKSYSEACKAKEIKVGKMFVVRDSNLSSGEKLIINFPTKQHWKKPSEYQYIKDGLEDLVNIIQKYNIRSIAIPPLGAGNGGLKWEKVKRIISDKLGSLPISVTVYEPTMQLKEKLKKERVKLTEARALLLYVLYDLVKNGEYVSEFSSEKVCYFLQRFGGKEYLNLRYTQNFYGPYSGKVRFLLNKLNGSYIMGYSDMSKKPFEPLTLVADGYEAVEHYMNAYPDIKVIGDNTKAFLSGFYSDFALELLSSVDYLMRKEQIVEPEEIMEALGKWSERKRSMFSNPRYLAISIRHIKTQLAS